jgi:hypothetical protein
MKIPFFYDWNATWEYMFPPKDIHSHCTSITVGNIDNSMHIAFVWYIFTPIRNRSRIKHSESLFLTVKHKKVKASSFPWHKKLHNDWN